MVLEILPVYLSETDFVYPITEIWGLNSNSDPVWKGLLCSVIFSKDILYFSTSLLKGTLCDLRLAYSNILMSSEGWWVLHYPQGWRKHSTQFQLLFWAAENVTFWRQEVLVWHILYVHSILWPYWFCSCVSVLIRRQTKTQGHSGSSAISLLLPHFQLNFSC